MAILQQPLEVGRPLVERAAQTGFSNASLAVVRDAIAASLDSLESTGWLERIIDEVPAPFSMLVKELGLAPIPEKSGRELAAYCQGLASSLIDRDLLRRKADLLGRLQRTDSAQEPERYTELQRELVRVEAERRALRED
jgi:DNA primase